MDLMEITENERLSREDAAARLHALADALARHNEVEFDRGGLRSRSTCPTRSTSSSRSRSKTKRGARGRAQMVKPHALCLSEPVDKPREAERP
jgi:hypothetical protein